MDCSPPGSSVHGILPARIQEWVAMPFSRGPSRLRDQIQVSHTAGRFFTTNFTWEAQLMHIQIYILHMCFHVLYLNILPCAVCCAESLSRALHFVTPWTVAHQAPLSMEFSRQECWSGLPCPSPGDPPNLGIEPRSPTLQGDPLPSEPPGKPICLSF